MKWWTVIRTSSSRVAASIHGEIFDRTADDFIAALGDATEVDLTVDSHGGDSGQAWKIYHALRDRQTRVRIRHAGSSAIIIALAGTHRVIESDGSLMTHGLIASVTGQSQLLRARADELDSYNAPIIAMVASVTGQSVETVGQWFTEVDLRWTPTEALLVGLADEIIEQVAASPATAPADALAPTEPVPDDTALVLDLHRALGKVRVPDRQALAREFRVFLEYQVEETRKVEP